MDMLDIVTDASSNIWISGVISGKVSFGESGTIDTISDVLPFIAKYNKDGVFMKVIKRKIDTYWSRNYRRTNYKIDTLGTIHQIILENNVYYHMTTDTSGVIKKVKIFATQNDNTLISHLILTDSGDFIVAGTFTDAFDFDNSSKNKFLTPKGTQDVFIAKYNQSGNLIDVWQLGGSGKIYISDNLIITNNYLSIGVISEKASVVDFDLGSDTYNISMNNSMMYACYDMSVPIQNDTISYGQMNDDQVADINPGSKGSYPMYLVNFHDTLFFVANDGMSGYELWKSDGTQKGTTLIKDLTPDGNSFNPPKNQNNYLVTDGTTKGTEIKTYNSNGLNLDFSHIVYEDSVIYLYSSKGDT